MLAPNSSEHRQSHSVHVCKWRTTTAAPGHSVGGGTSPRWLTGTPAKDVITHKHAAESVACSSTHERNRSRSWRKSLTVVSWSGHCIVRMQHNLMSSSVVVSFIWGLCLVHQFRGCFILHLSQLSIRESEQDAVTGEEVYSEQGHCVPMDLS